jgi:hypothetical protein
LCPASVLNATYFKLRCRMPKARLELAKGL